eukprot:2773644-Prymnesium_polylepis.1
MSMPMSMSMCVSVSVCVCGWRGADEFPEVRLNIIASLGAVSEVPHTPPPPTPKAKTRLLTSYTRRGPLGRLRGVNAPAGTRH